MTFGTLNYSQTATPTASASSYSLPPQGAPPQPAEANLSNGSLLKMAGIAAAAVITILGGGLWLHANLDKRIDRLESRYDVANADISRQLVDIKVQLAGMVREPETTPQRPN
jgi:hypothetical protein